jgi:hypothetical protein
MRLNRPDALQTVLTVFLVVTRQFTVEVRTPLTVCFDGDAHKQFEAIWQCLQRGRVSR